MGYLSKRGISVLLAILQSKNKLEEHCLYSLILAKVMQSIRSNMLFYSYILRFLPYYILFFSVISGYCLFASDHLCLHLCGGVKAVVLGRKNILSRSIL